MKSIVPVISKGKVLAEEWMAAAPAGAGTGSRGLLQAVRCKYSGRNGFSINNLNQI